MTHKLQPGQKLRMTNPDYNVHEEEWTVEEVSPDQIRFSRWRRWVRDIAYIELDSTDPYLGKVIQVYEDGVLIVEAPYTTHNEEFHIRGDKITQCPRSRS